MSICDLKDRFLEIIEKQDFATADTHELGEAVDMLKDCCEAHMYIQKAAYYEKVVEAMEAGTHCCDPKTDIEMRQRMYSDDKIDVNSL